MPRAKRQFGGSAPTTALVAVLLLTLAVAAVLTWEAWSASRSHRASAEGALRDYAKFAAENFADEAWKTLYAGAITVLSPVGASRGVTNDDRLFDPIVMKQAADQVRGCNCYWDLAPRFFFRYQVKNRDFTVIGDSLPSSPMRAWVLDTLGRFVASLDPERRFQVNVFYDVVEGVPRVLVVTVRDDPHDKPMAAYGFVMDFGSYARAALHRIAEISMLPQSLTHDSPTDSVMSVIVRDAEGRELFRSPVQYQPVYAATVPLWRRFDGPSVEVSLRPQAAGRLLIGGLPRTRLSVLLALLTLVGALVVIALLLARRAQELAQLRADFTSSVSHELRTPLSQILLFAETLHFRRAVSERDRENALVVIMREARRLAHLVDNVLLFSRTERRAVRVSAHPRPLAPIVRDVVGSFEPLARARQVTLRTSLDERVVAPVDPGALRQVLLNLLDNAVKYGPDAQMVDVGLAIQDSVARIWVEDQGRGISPSEYERIWEPFVRLESGEYSVTAGSGIGLSVVRQLVTLHGGQCWVEASSTRPEGGRPAGARFVVELPRASLGLIGAAGSAGERRDPAGQTAT